MYDILTDVWTTRIPLSVPRANHDCTYVKDKKGNIEQIFVTGGVGNTNAESALDTSEIFDLEDTSCKIGPSLPHATTWATLVHVEKTSPPRILLIGGCQYNKNGNRRGPCTEVYSLAENSNRWINAGNLKKSRIDPVALIITKYV